MVETTRSAGTFKLGLHGNMEEGACTHNLTETCLSKTQWFNYYNTRTEREKIKSELSITYTQQKTQKVSLFKQNHEKKPQKYRINEKNDNMYINTIKYHIINENETE
jgi:hypothetical protein